MEIIGLLVIIFYEVDLAHKESFEVSISTLRSSRHTFYLVCELFNFINYLKSASSSNVNNLITLYLWNSLEVTIHFNASSVSQTYLDPKLSYAL